MPTVKYMGSRQSRGVARSLSIFFISVVIGLSACQSQEVETIYGEATLFFNTLNESREYVSFANQKSQNIRFRPSINDVGFAGIYASDLEEYNETQDFHSSAKIDSIEVFCPPQNCASN